MVVSGSSMFLLEEIYMIQFVFQSYAKNTANNSWLLSLLVTFKTYFK